MPNSVENKILLYSRPAMNDINDSVPANQQNISGANLYASQLGGKIFLDGNPGGVRYDSAIGTLYAGRYQYVQSLVGDTNAPAKGSPCFWTDYENYIVSTAFDGTTAGKTAGVWLNTITKGNYGWIQTMGKATVKFKTGLTAATPADGDVVTIDTSSGLADVLTQSGNPTYATLKGVIGIAIGAPVSATASTVLLRGLVELP